MPFVNVKVVGSLSVEKRGQLGVSLSSVLLEVAGKPPAVTYLHFEESHAGQWVQGGETLTFSALSFPFVELKSAGPLSFEQREAIASGFHAALSAMAGPASPPPYLVIHEVPRDNWARAGKLLVRPAAMEG